MAEGKAETDRAGALEILERNGAGKVEAETAIGLCDRDGRTSLRPGLVLLVLVAGEETDQYIVYWKGESNAR